MIDTEKALGIVGNLSYTMNRDESYVHDAQRTLRAVVMQTREYERKKENGLLVEIPCNIGSTVYVVTQHTKQKYARAEVCDYTHFITCGFCVVVTSDSFDKQNIPFTEFGKTILLSEEEAREKINNKV